MDKSENRLHPMVDDIITSGIGKKHTVEAIHKVMLLNLISITGIIFMVPLGVVAFVQGNPSLGFIDQFTALILLSNLLYLRKSENYQFACSFGITIAAILFFYLFVTGGVNNTAHVWYYTFPLFSSFLLGSKKGAVATIILFFLAIIFFAIDLHSPYLTNYSKDFIIRFIPSFAVVFIYSYAFEYFREKAVEKLTAKNDELNRTIKELQETDSRLRKAQGGLEKRVQERTIELSNVNIDLKREIKVRERAEHERLGLEKQLVQSQKMESVGRLAGGVAHDYNNALSVVIGFTELAINEVDPGGTLRANLDEVLKAADRATDITRQLLAFARKQTIAPKVIDFNESVEGMLKMLRHLIGEDIDLAWLPGTSLWPVKMDPSQIDQVLANLCVNARDAIEGVGKITIETENATFGEAYCTNHANFVPGEFVLLAVNDNGCGIDKEMLDNIFEPFFTTKDVDKGTGLGLSMVYGITKQNNGFINVCSEPGKGTTIEIYVPRHEGKATEIQRESTAEIPPGRGETVLLVEDDLPVLKLARQILAGLGYTVLSAGTPADAMDMVEEHIGEIHLLVTDVIMPEMNGRELAKRLQPLYPDFKCLFMSGYTANVIAHHGVLDEGVHFIQKPFSRRALATTVRKVLDD